LEQTLQQLASAPPRSSAAVPIMNRKERILFDGVDWGARSGRNGGVSVGRGRGREGGALAGRARGRQPWAQSLLRERLKNEHYRGFQ
jgi:hypothetical protein